MSAYTSAHAFRVGLEEAFWEPVCAGGGGQERWDGEQWRWG
jgi:hypothetical protein